MGRNWEHVLPNQNWIITPAEIGGFGMAKKRHSDENVLKLLREIQLKLTAGDDVASACCSVGFSDATYYNWRKRFGGMGRSQLSELKSLEKENARLKKSVAELELDKLILKEGLNHLKPRVPLSSSSLR